MQEEHLDSIGGQNRNYIAALDATTGNALTWNPNANNWVTSLTVNGNNGVCRWRLHQHCRSKPQLHSRIGCDNRECNYMEPECERLCESDPHAMVASLSVSGTTVYAEVASSALAGRTAIISQHWM